MQISDRINLKYYPRFAPHKLRFKNPWLKLSLLALLAVLFALALTGCTAGRLRGDSNGWSPVSAVALPMDSGGRLNEAGFISPLDNTLTVTNRLAFELGQVIQIEKEQLLITSIRDDELTVDRGVNGTKAESHPGQSTIFTLGEQFVVFVITKQGEIQALVDVGSETPEVDASYSPPGEGR